MPFGVVLLFVVAALVYFGLAQRILDRMRLSDTQALIFLGLMVAGSFIELPLVRGPMSVTVNVGGALVPLALVLYLLAKADTPRERWRALGASVVTAGSIWLISRLTLFEPAQGEWIDPLWLFALIAGLVGYLAGRSRRSAFIAGTLGILLTDLVHVVQVWRAGMRSDVAIGGAGAFDAVILAGLIAVALAEVVGETRERLQGGPDTSEDRPLALHQDDGGAHGGESEGERKGEES